jgi:F-type H+-transporting ATPase subunit a
VQTAGRQVLVWVPSVLGIDLSITNEVVLLWAAAGLVLALLWPVCRRREPVARGPLRNLFEALIEFVDSEIVREGIGAEGRRWSTFLLALFFFILFANLLGLVPAPSVFKSVTANINVTGALALAVFGVVLHASVRQHGTLGFLRRFVPAGVPRWVLPMVVPIEVVSWLVKPVSLAIRLFANMVAGHTLLFVFISLEATAAWFIKPLPYAGAVLMECFELFVCFIQAFIFTMLGGMYIREALEAPH